MQQTVLYRTSTQNHLVLSIDKPLIKETFEIKSIKRKKICNKRAHEISNRFFKSHWKIKVKDQKFKKKKNHVVRKLRNWITLNRKLEKGLCKLDLKSRVEDQISYPIYLPRQKSMQFSCQHFFSTLRNSLPVSIVRVYALWITLFIF